MQNFLIGFTVGLFGGGLLSYLWAGSLITKTVVEYRKVETRVVGGVQALRAEVQSGIQSGEAKIGNFVSDVKKDL